MVLNKTHGLETVVVGPIETNCYLFWDPADLSALVVDPGDEPERILAAVRRLQLRVTGIVNTHGHADHLGANQELLDATGARLWIHAGDRDCLASPARNLSLGLGAAVTSPPAGGELTDDLKLSCGALSLQVLHTPGHSPGSVCLYGSGILLAGDTLFAGSAGRTDLPGGDARRLAQSLARIVREVPPDTLVYPGHGPATILARELQSNPFLVHPERI
jgi:hydroxyacylglutathione hydrolase